MLPFFGMVEAPILRALEHFKDDPILHVFAAQYYNSFRANHRIEQMHLNEAEVWFCSTRFRGGGVWRVETDDA